MSAIDPYADPTTLGTPTGSTMANGAPAESDQHSLSLSPNGPLMLHDMHLLDTLAHFNREN
ncbi:MAG TPA: catalase, partial [Ornithinibacter sp.]|nr:catalase [Ornithinibacter sp.]